ncbi:MAG: hypothetical protein AB8F34_06700 [Akkermansiaceae bacterium]
MILLLLSPGSASAQAILSPPFGLQWGDNMDKVLDWAEKEKLDMVIDIKGAQPDLRVIRVTSSVGPLPGHRAFALETRYHRGRLFEVTVHYGEKGAKPERLKIDFDKLKRKLTIKHGSFSPNNKQVKKGDGFVRESVSYHVEPVKGLMLMMMFTEMEDTLRKKRSARFSLLYRNQNIIQR